MIPSDRVSILQMSRKKILNSSTTFKFRPYQYDICFVSNLHQDHNKQIANVLFLHFDFIFSNEAEHLKKLMADGLTNVLFLVDHGENPSSTTIEKQNIVGAVMFAVCQDRFVVIDLISVTKEFRFKGIAPFLIFLTQVFGSEKIKANHIDLAREPGSMETQTILCCSMELIPTYETYGFQITNEPLPEYKEGGKYQYIGERMNIELWDVGHERLNIMIIDHYVTRFINVLSKPDFKFETYFFKKKIQDKAWPWENLNVSNLMKKEFKDSMSTIEQYLKYRPSSTDDQKLLKSLEKEFSEERREERRIEDLDIQYYDDQFETLYSQYSIEMVRVRDHLESTCFKDGVFSANISTVFSAKYKTLDGNHKKNIIMII